MRGRMYRGRQRAIIRLALWTSKRRRRPPRCLFARVSCQPSSARHPAALYVRLGPSRNSNSPYFSVQNRTKTVQKPYTSVRFPGISVRFPATSVHPYTCGARRTCPRGRLNTGRQHTMGRRAACRRTWDAGPRAEKQASRAMVRLHLRKGRVVRVVQKNGSAGSRVPGTGSAQAGRGTEWGKA